MDLGQDILPGGKYPLSASRINQTSRAVQAVRLPRGAPSANGQSGFEQRRAVVVSVLNKTNRDIEPGDPVLIERSTIDPEDYPDVYESAALVSSTLGLTAGNTGTWGIALQFIKKEGAAGSFSGPVLLKGIARVKVRKLAGDDNLVDMACFRNKGATGEDHKLYTSAAGCASILAMSSTVSDWTDESTDDDEVDAIVEVHGFRIVEPACRVHLNAKLRKTGEFSVATANVQQHDVTGSGRTANGFTDTAPGRRAAPRVIRVYGDSITGGMEAASGSEGWATVCPYSGDWIFTSLVGCLTPI
jgi:hypothetical protein